jgi:hypothetical protein
LLKIVYFGKTSFVLEYNEMKVLLNPGIWGRKKVVPNDFSARIVIATNQSDEKHGSWVIKEQLTRPLKKGSNHGYFMFSNLKSPTRFQI